MKTFEIKSKCGHNTAVALNGTRAFINRKLKQFKSTDCPQCRLKLQSTNKQVNQSTPAINKESGKINIGKTKGISANTNTNTDINTDKDTEKTKVIIRKDSEGFITAFFPEIPGDSKQENCLSFDVIGGHCAATYGYYLKTVQVNPESEEFNRIIQSLEWVGYNLEIRQKWTQKMDEVRKAEFNKNNF